MSQLNVFILIGSILLVIIVILTIMKMVNEYIFGNHTLNTPNIDPKSLHGKKYKASKVVWNCKITNKNFILLNVATCVITGTVVAVYHCVDTPDNVMVDDWEFFVDKHDYNEYTVVSRK
jgi:hypothetical protein